MKFNDYKNDERFIYSDDNHKSFSNPQSVDEFNKALDDCGLGGIKSIKDPDQIFEFINEIPKRKRLLQSLVCMRSYLLKSKDEKIKNSIAKIEEEYSSKEKFYDNEIKKLECLMFLEKEYGIKVNNSSKQENEEASSTSSE